jgi:hypothetical protein
LKLKVGASMIKNEAIKILLAISIFIFLFAFIFLKSYIFNYDKDFAYKNIENISKIQIESDSLLNVIEKIDGKWIINGEYPIADDLLDNIKIFVSNLLIKYPLPKMYAKIISDTLIKDKGINVSIFADNKLKRDYYLYSLDSLGCIGLVKGEKQAYCLYIPAYSYVNLYDFLNHEAQYWIDNIVFSHPYRDIIEIEVENKWQPEQSFKIRQTETEKFELIDTYNSKKIAHYDSLKMQRYLTYFNYAVFDNYQDISIEKKQEILSSLSSNNYMYKLVIKTKKTDEDYYIVPICINNEFDIYGKALEYDRNHFYLVFNNKQKIAKALWLNFDILLKNLSDFAI